MTDTVRVPREPTEAHDVLKLFATMIDHIEDWMDDDYCPSWSPFIPVAAYRKAHAAVAAGNRRTPPAMSADHIGDATNTVAPVEAVAWRVRRRKEDAGFGRPQVFTTDDASEADLKQWRGNGYEVQPLYTHPTPIKPSSDTGELRERVARIVDPAGFDDRWDVPGLRHEASLDERVDEALAKTDAILDLIQSERAG